jgi:hypothetical protein
LLVDFATCLDLNASLSVAASSGVFLYLFNLIYITGAGCVAFFSLALPSRSHLFIVVASAERNCIGGTHTRRQAGSAHKLTLVHKIAFLWLDARTGLEDECVVALRRRLIYLSARHYFCL